MTDAILNCRSREKLYGLKSLSKSQGVLDIYRSLECLKKKKRSTQRSQTEDMLPIFKQLTSEMASSSLSLVKSLDSDAEEGSGTKQVPEMNIEEVDNGSRSVESKSSKTEVEESKFFQLSRSRSCFISIASSSSRRPKKSHPRI